MKIRQEEIQDYEKVEQLVKEAFENAEHTDGNEATLVKNLRKSTGFIEELSMVALENDEIVGHIMFTKAKIGDVGALALAPLSVLPTMQKKGIGTALMQEAHKRAENLGYDIIVVLGSEKYYPRVGYKPASLFGIQAPFDVPDENFMALSLNNNQMTLNASVEYVKEIFE